ncbi:hypothetical protein [Chitinilyticum aquatile]|uniref:hypothetical protein n=1 Tax=Chitinilyticum aquatile TaxID=362520 RepID=UPI0012DC7372|nr:hypothetical protein [Chitinilyticum aquatile]
MIFEKNRPVMQVVIETYRQASPEGRKQFETSFIEACSQQRRNADTWGTDVGCGAYLTGLLNAGLPRDENGNFPGRDNPPMSAEAIASLALQIKLGTHDGQDVILDLSTRAETDGVVMAQYLESTQGVAVRCSKNLLSYDYGSQKELAQWAFKTPGTAIEKAALQALCGG